MTRVLRLAAPVLALLATLPPATSAAQVEGGKAAADALFDAARQMMDAKNYESACPKFKDSHALDPAVGTLLNLGLCYKAAGKTASAWTTYREAAALARKEGQSDREILARSEVKRLEPLLTKLVLEVSADAQTIEGLSILRDGSQLPKSTWELSMAVDPGEVLVEVTAPGYKSRQFAVPVTGEGEIITFPIATLEKASPPPAAIAPVVTSAVAAPVTEPEQQPAPKEATSPSPAEESLRSQRSILPWIVGGTGIAVAGGGTAALFFGRSRGNLARNTCAGVDSSTGEYLCESEGEKKDREKYANQAKAYQAIGWAGIGVGAAAIAGSVIWLTVLAPSDESALSVEPLVGESLWGLTAYGHF